MPNDAAGNPRGSALVWMALSAVVIVLDQLTKIIADTYLTYGKDVPVFPGFSWTLAYNPGAAFSFLADASGWQRWFFTIAASAISVWLVWWLSRLDRSQWKTAMPLALILGGAIGNLIDRVRLGHVIDFILLYYDRWHWPAFNIADSSVFLGALMLIVWGLRGEQL